MIETLLHAFDPYGPMVHYFRRNGVVAPGEPSMKDTDNTAIACSLTTSEFHRREAELLAQFRSAIVEVEELEEGYTFRLPGDDNWIALAAELILAERECCPFLTFELTALANKGPLMVRVIGPPGAKEFLKTVLWKPAGPG
jgi:hypothetical protein